MRLLAGVTLVALLGCELAPPGEPVAVRHDGLQVLVVGSPGAGLGEIVSSCSTTPLFAGRSEVRADVFVISPVPSVKALSCTPGPNPVYVAGANPGGLGLATAAGWAFAGPGVDSLARNPQTGTLLVGRAGGRVDSMVEGLTTPPSWDAGSVALAWAPDGTLFAAAGETSIDIFTWNEVTRTAAWRNSIPVGAVVRPNALVVGDFLPNGTRDVAVGTTAGDVRVFSEYGGAPMSLRGDGLSFGAALAVEPDYLASLDAILVGEPESSRVVRMFGDAGRGEWVGAPGDRFGAALAVLSNRKLLVGAPGADAGAGSISFEALVPNMLFADPLECDVGRRCSPARPATCVSGTCVGGVACFNPVPGCPVGATCLFDGAGYECVFSTDAGAEDAGAEDGGGDGGAMDAGAGDAGSTDAGSDPGSADAGAADAGSTDAGPVGTFSAHGCSSAGLALPWLLALLCRWRR